jgi:V/A-type H+/Na+-transporting ATPase subunit E
MENKLEVLTQKLYKEGIEKAEVEAQKILANARKESDAIIKRAEDHASAILSKAEDDASNTAKRSRSELHMMAIQAREKVRQELENMLKVKAIDQPLKASLSDHTFLNQILLQVVSNLKLDKGDNITIELPEAQLKASRETLKQQLHAVLGSEPTLNADHSLRSGFRISKDNQSYKISFTEEDFKTYLHQFVTHDIQDLLNG